MNDQWRRIYEALIEELLNLDREINQCGECLPPSISLNKHHLKRYNNLIAKAHLLHKKTIPRLLN